MVNYNNKLGLSLGLSAALALGGCATPKYMTLEDMNNMDKDYSVSQAMGEYVTRETKKLAADSDREATCLHKLGLEGKLYPTKADFLKENDQCVSDLTTMHKLGYGLLGVAIDGAKIAYLVRALDSKGDGGACNSLGSGNSTSTIGDSNTIGSLGSSTSSGTVGVGGQVVLTTLLPGTGCNN